ncbi:uncharacterized protein LOC114277597 [Camellia sinensis]|uniref:uncharacterized protein LOC114277597 n=1 Tax=Camellia sinensis TaxID=4442 RepID=UPI001035D4A1|nr:uncharacterized protein LOC114277597 [Camellia sinensis]
MTLLKMMDENYKALRGYLGIDCQVPLPDQEISSMDLLIWNCRGAGNKRFKRNLRKLVQIHRAELMIFMETKVEFKLMGTFFNCIGFTTSIHVDPTGRSGYIWMLWNPNVVNVRVVETSSQQIIANILRQDYPDWLLSTVYARPSSAKRDDLWDQLEAIAQHMNDPWLVAGDFNDFTTANDKRSFHGSHQQTFSRDQRRSRKFNERIDNCKLIDLGCIGPMLTWSNNREGWSNTMVRLDRAMCNTEWRTTFPDGAVRNLPCTYSDHSLMILFT